MKTVGAPRSIGRLFALYAAISLVPVLVLGFVLARSFSSEADRRGLSEGRSEAVLIAQTAVAPLLDGHPLSESLTAAERASLDRLALQTVDGKTVLRLRLRDSAGRVVFSDDGSGFTGRPDEHGLEAARGSVVSELTHLNTDANDTGARGIAAVEVYVPLSAGNPAQRVGVLEIYLPYAPIKQAVQVGLNGLYRDLAIGLAVLYLALFIISASVTRRLRRQVAVNAYLAEHDTLTELPNRVLFHRRAEEAVNSASRRGQAAALAIIDLDRFKEVNDTLGHANGDHLLAELGRRLSSHIRPGDTIARLGGDEFGLILRDVTDVEGVLWRVRDAIEHDVEVSGLALSVEASIGFAVTPTDGTDVGDLLQRADVAMYVAKAAHSGVARYDAADDHYDAANLELVAELRQAIRQGQLVLHYQPKQVMADETIESVEALVRWQHPEHGLLYPDRFLPLAEQTDLMDELTEWVLSTALADLRDLGSTGADLVVAVNISARNLNRADFASRVAAIIAKAGVRPERLILEITETALMIDPAHAAAILRNLDRSGVRISVDDFGRGQTSLGYLATLPIYELKIDQSFIADMLINAAHAAIVRSIVDLGHNLDLHVVGEGVESIPVFRALRQTGCDVAQGYLIAEPMPARELAAWLGSNTIPTPSPKYAELTP